MDTLRDFEMWLMRSFNGSMGEYYSIVGAIKDYRNARLSADHPSTRPAPSAATPPPAREEGA
jgi:hypothetical protein